MGQKTTITVKDAMDALSEKCECGSMWFYDDNNECIKCGVIRQ